MKMDTFVVLPDVFFLRVGQYQPYGGSKGERAQATWPWGLSVWTSVALPVGTRFSANQGTVVVIPLAFATGNRQNSQVWSNFDCFEEIRLGSKHYERYCNWVCFLQAVDQSHQANIRVYKVKGKPVFEVSRLIPACTELKAFFQITDHSINSILNVDEEKLSGTDYAQIITSEHARDRCLLWPTSRYRCRTNQMHQLASTIRLRRSESAAFSLSKLTSDGNGAKREISMWTSPKRGKERASLPCDVCGKTFDRPSLLRRHMRTHTGEKPHRCSVCGKAFSTSSSLNTHCRIHSGEKPHVCAVCGKRFTASSNLYYHRMTHKKDKPHKCTMCCKSFPTPGDLRSHMFVHNGSWPFKCQFCNRGFSKHTNLKNHTMLHTGEKPHACALCGKRFALVCNLKSHTKTHQSKDLQTLPCLPHQTTFAH